MIFSAVVRSETVRELPVVIPAGAAPRETMCKKEATYSNHYRYNNPLNASGRLKDTTFGKTSASSCF